MSSWSCPYDLNGICQKVSGAVCNPGMRGCILEGQVRFANEEKSVPPKPVKAAAVEVPATEKTGDTRATGKTSKSPSSKRRLYF